MVGIRDACCPESQGMNIPLFRESELVRAETIAKAIDGLDIYSAQTLLEKMKKYLLLTTFKATTD